MLEKNMKILTCLILVAVSTLSSMVAFVDVISFNHTESAPIIMLLLGLTLIGIAGTVKRRVYE